MKNLLGVVLAGLLLWCISSEAQQKPTVQIVIEQLSSSAAACGVDASTIEAIASLTLRNNGVKGTTEATNPYLYIQPTILQTKIGGQIAGCSGALYVEMIFVGPAPKTVFQTKHGLVNYELCKDGQILADSIAPFSRHLLEDVQDGIKVCLGKLDY